METRELMTVAPSPFATIPVPSPATPGGMASVSFHVNPDEFAMGRAKSTWIRIDDGSPGPGGLALGAVTGTVQMGRRIRVESMPTLPLRGGSELVRVRYGTYTMAVGPSPLGASPSSVEFSMAGATGGAVAVNAGSLRTIRSLLGSRIGSASYQAAADVNNDGRIDRADLALARANLGASTSVRPLEAGVTMVKTPIEGALSDRTVVVQTNPGAQVLMNSAVGGPQVTADADGAGVARLPASGITDNIAAFTVDVQVADGFGQHAIVTMTVPNALGEGFGEIIQQEAPYDAALGSPKSEWQKVLPDSVDLSTSPDAPPIYNQGQLGTCTANAVAWDYLFVEEKEGLATINDPSRMFLYYNARVQANNLPLSDSGAPITSAIATMTTMGVAPESAWPYSSSILAAPPASAYAAAQSHKVLSVYQIDNHNLQQVEGSLEAGYPVVVGIALAASTFPYSSDRTGVVTMPSYGEHLNGGHAIVLVGYDKAKGIFKFANSWGTDWGQPDPTTGQLTGYGYISFDYVASTLASGAYSIRQVS